MKRTFNEIREKLNQFFENGEYNQFNSSINELYYQLINCHPPIPDVTYSLTELQSYSHKLQVAEGENVQKYYQLSLQRLGVLECKAEQAGAI